MHEIGDSIGAAMSLGFGGEADVLQITLRSLWVSGLALLIAVMIGIPFGSAIAMRQFRGRRLVVTTINTGMAAPPVVVGLLVAMFLTRSGPLGELRLLYTTWAMVIAQVIIALPIIAGLSLAALQQLDIGLRQQIAALGAGRLHTFLAQLREVRIALLAAVMAAFGAVISEVGAVIMVGGNIKGQTQVLTGAIVQETRIGRFAIAVSLAVILMALAFGTNLALTLIQQKGRQVR